MKFYLITRLLAVTVGLVPVSTGLFIGLIKEFYFPKGSSSFGNNFYIAWGWTQLACCWTFLLFVLLPYSWIYLQILVKPAAAFYKYLIFFGLMTPMSLLVPGASHITLFNKDPFPRVFILFACLTAVICPICNYCLNKIAGKTY